MADVDVLVNGHSYSMACNDGEEAELRALAARVDGKLQTVVRMVGQIGEQRLLLMTAMLIADDLAGAENTLSENARVVAELKQSNAELQSMVDESDARLADQLEDAARKVEAVLATLPDKA